MSLLLCSTQSMYLAFVFDVEGPGLSLALDLRIPGLGLRVPGLVLSMEVSGLGLKMLSFTTSLLKVCHKILPPKSLLLFSSTAEYMNKYIPTT